MFTVGNQTNRLATRRFLGTYEIKNVTENDLIFKIELHSGLVVEQTLKSRAVARGVNGHAKNLLNYWIDRGDLFCKKEYQYVEENNRFNWKDEGF